jgi:hypothetical protein
VECGTWDDGCQGEVECDTCSDGYACSDQGDCLETCAQTNGGVEDCDGVDNDCDGDTDEAAELDPPRCTLYRGVCQDARKTCGGSAGWLDCQVSDYGTDYEETETICADDLDNDCDGPINEGCTCIVGQQQNCSGPESGICLPGTQACDLVDGNPEWVDSCDGSQGPEPETCNALDDDCDSVTDEGC